MCTEYIPARALSPEEMMIAIQSIKEFLFDLPEESPHLRIFPRGSGPIIFSQNGKLILCSSEFGLIPSWWRLEMNKGKSKTNRPVFATYNARLETASEKPTFRDSFKKFHCVVPMRAFFESSYFGDHFSGNRVRISSDDIFMAAGIYSEWIDKSTGEVVNSFSILTDDPPEDIFAIGHDRCPVLLNAEDSLAWISQIQGSEESLIFCRQKNKAADIKYHFKIDRELKAGWKKRAPSVEELDAVSTLEQRKKA